MSRLNLLAEVSIPAMPPSVNHYTKRTRGGGVTLTEASREFKRTAYQSLAPYAPKKPSQKPIAVEIVIHPANKRTSDTDNRNKLILDALEEARFIVDDKQVVELLTKRGEVVKGGRVDLIICEIE
ncbi:RusA family crossover junction endodeoxyribonuclease [Psychrobacter pygoscelis]|uniref:RusA family crossover junction endodeoxyribonuclease n=1 Tax=Psychrobacter pygoscelis TaxID=2488563 RepID=UPI00103EDD33|nr:RusA family crossover junction endodeoxyribonuclease [Psychrobacter pygoscelis]